MIASGEESVQIHGGIGMTAEHAAGEYVKGIAVNELLQGLPEARNMIFRRSPGDRG
jgi:alkylation response protein AidB-like acyl-CoA dehydrogenase